MTRNCMFNLEVRNIGLVNLTIDIKNNSILWHFRYGYLNLKGLKLLSQKGIVKEPLYVNQIGVCESYIFSKQARLSFRTRKVKRVTTPFKLIYVAVWPNIDSLTRQDYIFRHVHR